jgi:solute carrier family 25 citrate transporter 1
LSEFLIFPGIRGVYQGLVPTILKQGSNQAIRFFVMETLKNWYRDGDPKKPVPLYVVGAFGALAGACSVFGNTPIDVIKTRLQVSALVCVSEYVINVCERVCYKCVWVSML